MKNEEKFVKKRKFGIPLDTFVEIELSEKDAIKIRQWIKNHDAVAVCQITIGIGFLGGGLR